MPKRKKTVVIGLFGTQLDRASFQKRWERWRPSVAICQQDDLLVDRFDLLCPPAFLPSARVVADDIAQVSPSTKVEIAAVEFADPWDFEEVYEGLHAFARSYPFDTDREEYLVHITTGTHVAQICLFLLTESRDLPARLLQSSPPSRERPGPAGTYAIIDLDLSRYDRIATRFHHEREERVSALKSGISTRDERFNRLVDQIEHVAAISRDPILLMGPTGAGKSQLARRIFELKSAKRQLGGEFVEVNCATLRGDQAMSALFGHVRGAFTGAMRDRPGLLRAADGGLLFLDEIGELGLDEQAMLLRALEEKRFLPLGGDRESRSDFQLIAGTNRDLGARVAEGRFRDDLLARINLWTFRLPGLRERLDDLEPNLDYELDEFARRNGTRAGFNREARERFLRFAVSHEAVWSANFRDLNAAVVRMATLAYGGRITVETVDEEIARLRAHWRDAASAPAAESPLLEELLGEDRLAELDRFDRMQLQSVVAVCREHRTLSDAGRALFGVSRGRRRSTNDADRLRKYLARFGLDWKTVT
jgi:transcriptional regulatory protein RtcR